MYDQPIDVLVTSPTPGATVVYTTDGSVPTLQNGVQVPAATPQSDPRVTLHMAATTTLRVGVFRDEYLPSRTQTWTYVFPADVMQQDYAATLAAGLPPDWRGVAPDYGLDPDIVGPADLFGGLYRDQFVASLKSLPSISLVMNVDDMFGDEGIYANPSNGGFDWERPTSVEFLSPDGSVDFQVDAGIRIAGGASREHNSTKKKSFRLVFRNQYGASKLKFPLFGPEATDRFDTIVLRNNYNDGWQWNGAENLAQYARDQWARATQLAMDQPSSHGTYMHLYINGFYWGLYNPSERPDAPFSAAYSGGDKDQWDSLNTGVAVNGSADNWAKLNRLAAAVNTDDADASNAAYQRLLGKRPDGTVDPTIETLLDVDNLIDYMILNLYDGNTDWPGRNWYVGRRRGPESTGFEFYAWDSEWIFDLKSSVTTDRTSVSDGVASVYGMLRNNAEFRLRFADRVQRAFSPGGALYVDPAQPQPDPATPGSNVPAARYREITDQIELPLIAESARWGDQHFEPTYTVADWRAERDALLTDYFGQRSAIVLEQLRQAGLYPEPPAPEFSQSGGSVPQGWALSISGPGTIYYTLDGSDPRAGVSGGAAGANLPVATASIFQEPIELRGSIIVKARALLNGQWSPLREATFFAGPPSLRVTELMYHPAQPTLSEVEAGVYSAEDFEFLEVTNISPDTTVALDGLRFTAGIEFDFSDSSVRMLAPSQSVIIGRNLAALATRYGPGLPAAGQYGGTRDDFRLSNSGELLRLIDGSGAVIQEFAYLDTWYPTTDGQGYSLEIVDPTSPDLASWNSALNWRPSARYGGTPTYAELGDFDADGQIDAQDLDLLCAAIIEGDPRFDLTSDATTDQADLTYFVLAILQIPFGDADLDGVFNSHDLVLIFQAGEYEDGLVNNSTWAEGDWNCDGEFESSDLVLVFQMGSFVAESVPDTSNPHENLPPIHPP
jgi:hypothetical protein